MDLKKVGMIAYMIVMVFYGVYTMILAYSPFFLSLSNPP